MAVSSQQAELDELKATRDFLFELFDRAERKELIVALRIINREIKRLSGGETGTQPALAANQGQAWNKQDDMYLASEIKKANTHKVPPALSQQIKVYAAKLKRSAAEIEKRIKELGLLQPAITVTPIKPPEKSKSGWQAMPVRNDSGIPGTIRGAYQGFSSDEDK